MQLNENVMLVILEVKPSGDGRLLTHIGFQKLSMVLEQIRAQNLKKSVVKHSPLHCGAIPIIIDGEIVYVAYPTTARLVDVTNQLSLAFGHQFQLATEFTLTTTQAVQQ